MGIADFRIFKVSSWAWRLWIIKGRFKSLANFNKEINNGF